MTKLRVWIQCVLACALTTGAASATDLAFIEIEGAPIEYQSGTTWLGGGSDTLLGLVTTIDTLAFDEEFEGLVIRLKDAQLGVTHVEELGRAISRYRDEGKQVHVYAEGFGPGDLLLASYADEVILQRGGMVSFPGLHAEEMYLASMLEWIGVEAQLVQVGDFKGANETMTRAAPSEAWDANISLLMDAMYANMRAILMDGRGLSDAELDDAMRAAWAASGAEAFEHGLVDSVVDLPELREHLGERYGDEVSWVRDPYEVDSGVALDLSNPFAFFSMVNQRRRVSVDHPSIAVLHINGTIIDGDSTGGGILGGGSSTGSRTIRNAIEQLIDEDLIEGVVVRIDSPGGSAIASEIIWQGITRLREHKPVWVSVGSMAASGGYYILVGGDRVYVNPTSIVGSIGVVGGKYALGDLFDKVRVNVVERSRGPRASLMSSASEWDREQLGYIREEMTDTYELFAMRVEQGRDGIKLSETAEGRLFVGSDAVELEMADELGGLDDAINDLAYELEIEDYDVVHYPEPPSFESMLQETLGGIGSAPGMIESSLRVFLGDARYDAIIDQLNAMMLLREERVLLVNPRALIFR